MKIYFAGSIRGGRDFAADYQKIIHYLSGFGIVLTEHIANEELLSHEVLLTDKQIHDRDIAWLEECDCLIAEVTQASMGVGYELATALFLKKPVLCLFNTSHGFKLSAMIAGQIKFTTINYKDLDEVYAAIQTFFVQFFLKQI